MNIQLKNIKIFNGMSQETTSFTATLYVNNVKIAYVSNGGTGGSTNVIAINYELRNEVEAANAYCKKLPPVKTPYGSMNMNLELFIDNLIEEEMCRKEDAKTKKLYLNSVVYGNPKTKIYARGFKNRTIVELKQTEQGRIALNNLINDIKSKLNSDQVILNDNL